MSRFRIFSKTVKILILGEFLFWWTWLIWAQEYYQTLGVQTASSFCRLFQLQSDFLTWKTMTLMIINIEFSALTRQIKYVTTHESCLFLRRHLFCCIFDWLRCRILCRSTTLRCGNQFQFYFYWRTHIYMKYFRSLSLFWPRINFAIVKKKGQWNTIGPKDLCTLCLHRSWAILIGKTDRTDGKRTDWFLLRKEWV